MEAVGNCQHLVALAYHAGHAQRILVCLGTRVDEERAPQVGGRHAHQFLGRGGTHFECNRIGLEQQARALLVDRTEERRVAVAERGYGVSAIEIEDVTAFRGDDVAARRALGNERQLAVYRQGSRTFARPRICRRELARRHHVHPGALAESPAVSGRLQSRFIHCIAPPAAPLTRLSMTLMTATEPSPTATPMQQ